MTLEVDITYTAPGAGAQPRTLFSRLADTVNVRDYGALGDGTGHTPTDTGVDIYSAAWNTWAGTPFETNLSHSPWGTGGTFNPPRATPFLNTDTWDYIGITLAMWQAKATYLPAGIYLINVSGLGKSTVCNGLYIMSGLEQIIFGDGPEQTTIQTKEDSSYFSTNQVGVTGAFQLFTIYRGTGQATHIRDLSLSGPISYSPTALNLDLIQGLNINGVTFRELWLTSASRGLALLTNTSDCHATGITAEFCFDSIVYVDSGSELDIDFCNLWSSAPETTMMGIHALGNVEISSCRFMEFGGGAVLAMTGSLVGCHVWNNNGCSGWPVSFSGAATVLGNDIVGNTSGGCLNVVTGAVVSGNRIIEAGEHHCIGIGNGNAGSATNLAITGNVLTKSNNTAAAFNYAVLATHQGVDYTGAATASVFISGNVVSGNWLSLLGTATLRNNMVNAVLQVGAAVMSGSFATPSSTITITGGSLDPGDGSIAAQQRLYLISVVSTGLSHAGQGFALYTNLYDGTAVLLNTLGTKVTNGSMTFGTSGNNPTVAITSSGTAGTVSYTVTMNTLV